MKVSATDYLLKNIQSHLRNRYKSKYFAVCNDCGSISWVDYEDDGVEDIKTSPNELMKNGEVETPKRLIDFLVQSKKYEIKLLCAECEKELQPILFCDVDKKMRIKVYNMSEKERINFANGYDISEALRRENDFKEIKKQ